VRRTLRGEGQTRSNLDESLVIPPLDAGTGLLPLGRHVCAESEVEARFVSAPEFVSSTTRQGIWQDWQSAVGLLRTVVAVHAAWLGGSFTTSKTDPGDIDATFLINGDGLDGRSLADRTVASLFIDGRVKAQIGLNIDSYAMLWRPIPQPMPFLVNRIHDQYYWARGYWDDWWQRHQVGGKGRPPQPEDAVPRRGYLEVSLSDYSW
jgi:Family of unknown function (DUF6932)